VYIDNLTAILGIDGIRFIDVDGVIDVECDNGWVFSLQAFEDMVGTLLISKLEKFDQDDIMIALSMCYSNIDETTIRSVSIYQDFMSDKADDLDLDVTSWVISKVKEYFGNLSNLNRLVDEFDLDIIDLSATLAIGYLSAIELGRSMVLEGWRVYSTDNPTYLELWYYDYDSGCYYQAFLI